MALCVESVRQSFDPWSAQYYYYSNEANEGQAPCKGCTKIFKARAAAAAASSATVVAQQTPHARGIGAGE